MSTSGASYFDPRRALGVPALCFNLLVAAMLLVLLARNSIVLLAGWEIMTLAGYFLITFEHELAEIRRAGWVYLIASHLGFGCLVALFVLLAGDHGYEWAAGPEKFQEK